MKIFIDGDGCPVVDIAVETARTFGAQCVIICDTSHEIIREGASTVTVSKGADSADFEIVNRIAPGDIVVTQDYGLCALVLARKGRPLTQNGLIITDFNIGALLTQRHESKKVRMSGGRVKGPPKRTQAQSEAFEKSLRAMIGMIP